MHYIPLIDAGISGSEKHGTYLPYDEGMKEDIFIKDGATDQPFVGKTWNFVSTVWPDFTNPKTQNYYFHMMSNMHDSFAYDGAWIVCIHIFYYLLVKIKLSYINNIHLCFVFLPIARI